MKEKKNFIPFTRREFIKTSSTITLGSALVADPYAPVLARTMRYLNLASEPFEFSCEIIRSADMLHLKYYFFNAARSDNGSSLVKKIDDDELFVYVKTPSQHIAEELETNIEAIGSRDDWQDQNGLPKRKSSFLSGSSWLAFRLIGNTVDLTEDFLLNWNENFQLVTIDDFAAKNRERGRNEDYGGTLQRIKDELKGEYDQSIEADTRKEKAYQRLFEYSGNEFPTDLFEDYLVSLGNKKRYDGKSFLTNDNVQGQQKWPITKFDLPYKMFLSPLGNPDKRLDEAFNRLIGEHQFVRSNKKAKEEFSKGRVKVLKPWENRLIYKDQLEDTFDPRFKIVGWLNQLDEDNDDCVELLPTPVHREELHRLTMRREFDRDVLSEHFRISVLGGSTYYKYRNDNPLRYSTVAWEQDIKYARDNYVSITFRAVDVQTSLKLLVSIVSERKYKYGVSFLQKRYFVTYAEKEKNYDSPLVISRIPFVKIIPKSAGSYFKPFQPKRAGSYEVKESFVVRKEVENGTPFDPEDVIPFDYIGIDKNGKEHSFSLKISFIPAESYVMTDGTYVYNGTNYTSGKPIPFTDIGFLNPLKDERYLGAPPPMNSEDCDGGNYKYKLTKNFDDSDRRTAIENDLKELKKHFRAYSSCYNLLLNKEISYAKIDELVDRKVIDPNSSSSSFETKDLFLFTDLGDVATNPEPGRGSFSQDFPLRPKLEETNLIISQIDQMEGSSQFRKVRYATDYFQGNVDLEAENPANNVKLLFELVKWENSEYKQDAIGNFFKDNYKRGGAMANPGIPITHVSILDQGITYNEKHNLQSAAFTEEGAGKRLVELEANKVSSVSSISIFGELDAEILGISLIDIVKETFPVDDLPIFNYLKEAQDTLAKLERLASQYKDIYDQWKDDYDNLVKTVNDLVSSLKGLDDKLKGIAKDEARNWIESILEQSRAQQYFAYQKSFVETQLTDYYNQVLKPVKEKIHTTYSGFKTADFNSHIQKLIEVQPILYVGTPPIPTPNPEEIEQTIQALNGLLKHAVDAKVKSRHFQEAVKIYCLFKLTTDKNLEFSQKVSALSKVAQENEVYAKYQQALVDGLREANLMAESYLQSQVDELRLRYKESLNNMEKDVSAGISNLIIAGLSKIDFFSPESLEKTISPLINLANIYEDHQKIYASLKGEYYEKLGKELKLENLTPDLAAFESEIIRKLKAELKNEVISATQELENDPRYVRMKAEYNSLRTGLDREINAGGRWLSDYDRKLRTTITNAAGQLVSIEQQVENALKPHLDFIATIDDEYENLLLEISGIKTLLKKEEAKLKNFIKERIKDLENEIDKRIAELASEVQGTDEYRFIQSKIRELKALRQKIREASHQKLNYRQSTNNFRRASLGGIIDFVPNKTELDIDVNYELQLAIDSFDRPPSIVKQEFTTSSTLKDFKLCFLKLISIDFDRVSFITGSNIKDDFIVNIRDVQFAGSLSFVQKFQEYLKTLDPNLVFDITSSYAKVGYGISFPNFTGGYFNFFNFNLNTQLILPFNPDKSLQMRFGFGSEENKFGITVSAIFGGQGYFNLIAEPKRGIVGMILCLEFGAIFTLNLYVARGTAYLVGGVFIKRYSGNYEIRAYILCVGRFDVLGLFSAGMTFYLGLSGNGDTLYGECVVTVTKKFSRFFKISVSCRMRKQLKGAKSENNSGKSFRINKNLLDEIAVPLIPVYGNLYNEESLFYSDQGIELVFKDDSVDREDKERGDRFKPVGKFIQDGSVVEEVSLTFSANEGSKGSLYFLNADLEELGIVGDVELEVQTNTGLVFFKDTFSVIDNDREVAEAPDLRSDTVESELYFESYYPQS